jgi:hypothetical protein
MLQTGKNHPKMKKTKGIISARGNEGTRGLAPLFILEQAYKKRDQANYFGITPKALS